MELTYYYNNKIMKQHLQQQQHNDQMTNAITANNKPTYYEITTTTTTTTTTRRRKRTHRNILSINVIIVIVVIINVSLVSPSCGFQQISSLVTTRPLLLPLLPNTRHRSLFHQRTTTITTSGTTNNNNYLITTTSLFQSLSSPLGGTSSYLSSLSQQQQQHYGINDKTLIDNKNNNNNNTDNNDIFGGPLTKLSNSNDDDNNNESTSFLSQMSVPIFAAIPPSSSSPPPPKKHQPQQPIRRGLDGIIPHAFLLSHTLSPSQCQTMKTTIDNLDDNDPFVTYNAGKNHHDALQIVVTPDVAQSVFATIYPYVDPASLPTNVIPCGINRRWRVYRYAPSDDGDEGQQHRFAPHIDAGFPGSGLSQDGKRLVWDDYEDRNIVSRMTVLLYLNDDFDGGETIFYAPLGDDDDDSGAASSSSSSTTPLRVVAAVVPELGAALIFPQAVGEEEVEYARRYWPLHEGSPVRRGAAKYVIRTDLLCQTVVKADGDETKEDDNRERDDVLFRYDDEVSITFNPSSSSSSKSPYFLAHISSLYQPHMGVENLGPFLYSFIRFVKSRTIVEIGAGYTTLFILRALFDNDEEMGRIGDLMKRGRCRLLDVEWTVEEEVEKWETTTTKKSKLLCVDDCLHQKQTAGSVVSMAKCWGYDNYLDFRQGNVFEMDWGKDILGDDDDDDETRRKTIDLLWCDFGVGDRLSDFIRKAWRYITPGGYFVCHSTVTNSRTREWLEAVRNSKQAGGDYRSESVTGLPPGEYVELSLWEHHKRFQNSITILQKRPRGFEEPVYSEYA